MSLPEGLLPFIYFVLGALVVLLLLGLWRVLARRRAGAPPDSPERELSAGIHLIDRPRAQPVPERYWLWMNLTAREMDVAQLAARGFRNSDIARHLHLQPGTVTAHLKNIYAKLDIHSRVELANLLREIGDPPPDDPQ